MSAFLCSPEHLNALVNYAASHTRGGCSLHLIPNTDPKLATDAEYTFRRLLSENLKSLEARYDKGALDAWTSEPFAYRYDLEAPRSPQARADHQARPLLRLSSLRA